MPLQSLRLFFVCCAASCLSCLVIGSVDATGNPTPQPAVVMPAVPGGRHCVFPFWWRDSWHHTCVRYSLKGETWCSLSANFSRDENWKRCDSHDEKRFRCSIPFAYAGAKHFACLPMSLSGPPVPASAYWCGLTPVVAQVSWPDTNWAFCESPNATTVDYLKAVGPHRSLAEARMAALAKIGSRENIVKSEAAAVAAQVLQVASGSGSGGGVSGEDGGGGSGGSWGAGLVVSLGVACALMAVAVATVGCTVHRKYFRGRYKRIDPLLTSDPMEKSSYGGVEAYHD